MENVPAVLASVRGVGTVLRVASGSRGQISVQSLYKTIKYLKHVRQQRTVVLSNVAVADQ